MEAYVERPPRAELAGVVRTVWTQRTAEKAYVQRSLPSGGVEIDVPTRLTEETGFEPACDVAAAVADYVAWRADNPR
ncbi:hypothetical protein [Dactylosporangium sp. CA-139066]|uniref:hypothetical protein n=1 Tax=Dactylosporangium sp. CA-139066 TaxID=3239930 RepID=UPI003D8F9536